MITLPVRILDFEANRQSAGVTVNLKVSDLEAGNRVAIERSGDGRHWNTIHEETIGESVRLHISQHYDQQAPNDQCLYRMRVGDSRVAVYSSVVSTPAAETINVTVFPNPAANIITIKAQPPAVIYIYCPDGVQAYKGRVSVTGTVQVDISKFAAGTYLIWTNKGWTRFIKN